MNRVATAIRTVEGHTRGEFRAPSWHWSAEQCTLLEHHGATNTAEFFVVATECFFEKRVIQDYYLQDPAARVG